MLTDRLPTPLTSLVLTLLCLWAWGPCGAVVFVDQDAPGPGHDGTTWDTAFAAIQEGVDAATPGGEVWVADGVYVENVVMGEGVAVYGGFLGAEPGGYEDSLDQRDYVNNVTTIDGNQSGSCVVMAPGSGVDGFAVAYGKAYCGGGFWFLYTGEAGAIRNCTITGCTAQHAGGAVWLHDASPDIVSNAFVENTAGHAGGAIFCLADSSPTVCDNAFERNQAGSGGAVACASGSAGLVESNLFVSNEGVSGGAIWVDHSSPSIVNNEMVENCATDGGAMWAFASAAILTENLVRSNSASSHGGGLYVCNCEDLLLAANAISGNSAESDGGGIHCFYASPSISGNLIDGNSAEGSGGGICCYDNSSPEVTGNAITHNSAYWDGGGICCYRSSPNVISNTISGNSTHDSGGGIGCWMGSLPTVVNNTITDNSAWHGGGICAGHDSSPTMSNNTIVGNAAVWGAGIECYHGSSPLVSNNILTENSADDHGGGVACLDGSWPALSHNDVWANSPDDYYGCEPGEGDISADPLFVNPENGDFHLLSDSPCIDAGCNDYVFTDEDIDGDPRIIWAMRFPVPYWPHPGYVDIGADEFVPGRFGNPLMDWRQK